MTLKQLITALATLATVCASAQTISVEDALFKQGDDLAWKAPSLDDAGWNHLKVSDYWDHQGYFFENGYAWYRIKVVIPSSLRKASAYKDAVVISMTAVDDSEETFLNGSMVGKSGFMPSDPSGYVTAYNQPRRYIVPSSKVKWDKENVIAVRVYNGVSAGGIYGGPLTISMATLEDLMGISFDEGDGGCSVVMTPLVSLRGTLEVTSIETDIPGNEAVLRDRIRLLKGKPTSVELPFDFRRQSILKVQFRDDVTGTAIVLRHVPKYILTPDAPASPRYNGPAVFGFRPLSPVIFKAPFSGEKPIQYSALNLPETLHIDPSTGIITGHLEVPGDYEVTLQATNAEGSSAGIITFKCGDTIALTPPMGWNSWNCWGTSVSQEKVMSSARAILSTGLADYGYSYINIDDAWQAPSRNPDGSIAVNEKFPDMKGLGEWLHSQGLRFGIYSSPGRLTCGGYTGTLGHEEQDAETYNDWGVDYLKYDWCYYDEEYLRLKDRTVAAFVRPYLKMEEYLRAQPRDIFYSLCQYGMASVWKWGSAVDANSWRTTGDITDTWKSLYDIGFVRQKELYPYSCPGHWNDPDMLIVGKVGWSSNLRDSRLTADEQYTHISLWALLAANMLIGCDVAQIDAFTLGLLCNNEVNAVGQDILGQQARCVWSGGDIEIWARPLSDGSTAVGVFNLGPEDITIDLPGILSPLGPVSYMRDLWLQKDLSPHTVILPTHGVRLLKIR